LGEHPEVYTGRRIQRDKATLKAKDSSEKKQGTEGVIEEKLGFKRLSQVDAKPIMGGRRPTRGRAKRNKKKERKKMTKRGRDQGSFRQPNKSGPDSSELVQVKRNSPQNRTIT